MMSDNAIYRQPSRTSCCNREVTVNIVTYAYNVVPMALASGTKFGPYEILSKIGAGGMGEVYRARDTRLERSVAIKVLPSEFSSQGELRKRLERESRVLST